MDISKKIEETLNGLTINNIITATDSVSKRVKREIVHAFKETPYGYSTYKDLNSYEKRCIDSNRIIAKYSNRIPIIIETYIFPNIHTRKYLVSHDMYVSYIIYLIRRDIKLDSTQGIFLFCDDFLVNTTQTIGEIYEKYKLRNNITYNGDKMLYFEVRTENVFG